MALNMGICHCEAIRVWFSSSLVWDKGIEIRKWGTFSKKTDINRLKVFV